MEGYEPPFHMTDRIIELLAAVSEEIGRIRVLSRGSLSPKLRRGNRIRSIHSSLAIEHNSLSLAQVTAILDGKRVLGAPNEIREVKNAYDAYEMMLTLDPYSVCDLLLAHREMMKGLIAENGRFRAGGVGVFDGKRLLHVAPPASLVPGEIENLFEWYKASRMHPLIKSAVFHYEFEFIHPFADGNGRMGRMWHSMLLGRWNDLFYWLPVEELIRSRQQEYYAALAASDAAADSSLFAELMLEILWETLRSTEVVGETEADPKHHAKHRNEVLADVLEERILTALRAAPAIPQKDLAAQLGISYSTLQRAMKELQEKGRLRRAGGKRYGHWEFNE